MDRATVDETDELINQLQEAASYMYQSTFYQNRFDKAGITPDDIDSIESFRQLPAMTPKDLANDFAENPPFGSILQPDRPIVRTNFTPNPVVGMLPVVWTEEDLLLNKELTSRAFRNIGVTEKDVVLNTMSFTPYPAGWTVGDAAEEIGANHIPTGPGDTDQQVEYIKEYDVTAITGFPSFLLELANAYNGVPDGVEILIAGGEPFTAIDGYREQVRDAYGGEPTVVDGYGLAEFGGGYVAIESREEAGMHIYTDRLFPEVIDPETGELLDRGEKGELVLTTLQKEGVPLLRLRTGDLTRLSKRDSEYGEYVLPDGVFGRTDDQLKVKGVKLYPTELQMHLAGEKGIDPENIQIRLSSPDGTVDRISMILAGDPEPVDKDGLKSGIESIIRMGIDELTIESGFEVSEDEMIVDNR